jgi:glycogen debranching enzyme
MTLPIVCTLLCLELANSWPWPALTLSCGVLVAHASIGQPRSSSALAAQLLPHDCPFQTFELFNSQTLAELGRSAFYGPPERPTGISAQGWSFGRSPYRGFPQSQ